MSPGEALVSSGLTQGQGLWLQQSWESQCVSPTTEPTKPMTHKLESNYTKEVLALLQKF